MSQWHGQQGNRHQRGYGSQWEKLRRVVLERDRYLCQCAECKRLGRVRIAQEVDHIIPKAQGGSDELQNLQSVNHECHRAKTVTDSGGVVKARIGVDGWPITTPR